MFVTILYVVFQYFLSMISILHVQIMYNVHKPLTIISMIFCLFYQIFLSTGSGKTDEIDFAQNRSGKLVKPVGLSGFIRFLPI
jgi:predicted ferric reductase